MRFWNRGIGICRFRMIAEVPRLAHKFGEFRRQKFADEVVNRSLAIRSRSDMARNFVALLVAFAFALQSFLTQTHIHGVPAVFGGSTIVKIDADSSGGSKAPADSSPLDCPYCQAIAHSGLFFMPAAPLLRLPAELVHSILAPDFVQVIKIAATLHRRSRAPPL